MLGLLGSLAKRPRQESPFPDLFTGFRTFFQIPRLQAAVHVDAVEKSRQDLREERN